jgi:hypothetical protein
MTVPSLFLSPAEWAGLQDKLSDPFFAAMAEKNRRAIALYDSRRGETLLVVPPYLDSLISPVAGLSYRVIKGRLIRAAIALHASGDESAWPFALETIDFLLHREYWHVSLGHKGARLQHFDLKMGDLLYDAVFALEAFHERLDPERRAGLLELVIEEGLGAYLRGWEAREWWREANFNWAAATHGNAGLAALAVATIQPELSSKVMGHVRHGLAVLIESLPLDGWWTEGLMYQTTTIGHLSDFVIALYRVTGDDLGLAQNARWIEFLDTRPYALAPDGKALNFSNCPTALEESFSPQMYWWAHRLGCPAWTAFLDLTCKRWPHTTGLFFDVEAFFYRPAHPPLEAPKQLARLRHFRGLDWLTWRGPSVWLAFRSGNNNGNHNNFDLGHFILGRGRERYLIDPGYGFMATSQHNAVTIHGQDQTKGATARILHHREIPGGLHIACDLRECYPYIVEHHVRHLVLLADAHLFVIDDLRARNGIRLGAKYHFQSEFPAEVTRGGCRIVGNEGSLALTSLTGHAEAEINLLPSAPSKDGPVQRSAISFFSSFDSPAELSVFRMSFSDDGAPAFSVDSERRQLSLKTGDDTFVINLQTSRMEVSP